MAVDSNCDLITLNIHLLMCSLFFSLGDIMHIVLIVLVVLVVLVVLALLTVLTMLAVLTLQCS